MVRATRNIHPGMYRVPRWPGIPHPYHTIYDRGMEPPGFFTAGAGGATAPSRPYSPRPRPRLCIFTSFKNDCGKHKVSKRIEERSNKLPKLITFSEPGEIRMIPRYVVVRASVATVLNVSGDGPWLLWSECQWLFLLQGGILRWLYDRPPDFLVPWIQSTRRPVRPVFCMTLRWLRDNNPLWGYWSSDVPTARLRRPTHAFRQYPFLWQCESGSCARNSQISRQLRTSTGLAFLLHKLVQSFRRFQKPFKFPLTGKNRWDGPEKEERGLI